MAKNSEKIVIFYNILIIETVENYILGISLDFSTICSHYYFYRIVDNLLKDFVAGIFSRVVENCSIILHIVIIFVNITFCQPNMQSEKPRSRVFSAKALQI